ncbi:MAG: HAD-IIA family hydrolase [Acidimicrobiia bacterium]
MTGTLVCDLDGVVYLGEQEIPGSGAALRRLHEAGWHLVFCTNNATRTAAQTAEKIHRTTGFVATADQVATSAQAAATLVSPDDSVFVLGGQGLNEAVEQVAQVTSDWRRATAVVVGLDPGLSYERLSGAVLAVGAGARVVASNHDPTYPTPEGRRPGAGALVAAVVHATGVHPVVAGKPNEPMRRLLASRTQGETWIVGDRDDTDLAMGRAEGWKTIRVATGIRDVGEAAPDLAVSDLAAAADHLLAYRTE